MSDVKPNTLKPTPEPFIPPPIVYHYVVVSAGIAIFLFAQQWPGFILITTTILSTFIPYCFRTTDHALERRRLYRKYVKTDDPLIKKVLTVPEYVRMDEGYWINSRGMALCTSVLTPKHRDVKAVVFFCHGFCDNASFLKRYNFRKFVKAGIAVASIEYEGHGRSDGALGLIPDFDQMVSDAVEYFQEVATHRFPGKDYFLVGESMGGAVSFRAYKKKPTLFKGVVFVSPMCKISEAIKPPQWIINLLLLVTGPVGWNGYLGYLPVAPQKQDWGDFTHRDIIMKDLGCSVPFHYDRNLRLTTARELLHAASTISSQLESFDAPFLVQHGSCDKVTDPKLSEGLYNESSSSDKTIKLYDGMFHSITADIPSDTEIVLHDSIEWILKRC